MIKTHIWEKGVINPVPTSTGNLESDNIDE